ncbi:MAG: hypothetical protein CL927_03795 [Deltaproteobacteria bacterium]|nr:hypothetical protein [Deltaproteobacteria bacterium]HCH66190.1 hypothetical protein [Deltaproteobacteria bacterium]
MSPAPPESSAPQPPTFDEATAKAALRSGVVWILVFAAALALAVLAVARSEFGAQHALDILKRAQLGYILAATAIMSFAFVFMSLRWRALLPPDRRPPVLGLTAVILAGLLLNYALPGPMGELGAAWFASRRYKVGLAEALTSGVTARLIGLGTAALLGALFWIIAPLQLPPGTAEAVGLAAAAIGLGGLALLALTLRPDLWILLSRRLAERFDSKRAAGRIVHRIRDAVISLATAAHDVLHDGRKKLLVAAAWSTAGHLTVTLGIAVAILGFECSVEWFGLVFTYTTTTAGAVVLFAFPGSQLGWDAMFATLLSTAAQVPQADAIAISILVRLQQLGYTLLGAIVVAWFLRAAPKMQPASEDKSFHDHSSDLF